MVDYKILDKKAIINYLEHTDGVVDMEDIVAYSGANELRVYPILMELLLEDRLEVVQESELGGMEKVRLLR